MKKQLTLLGVVLCMHAYTNAPVASAQAFPVNTWVALTKAGTNSAAKNYRISTSTNPALATFTAGTAFTAPYDLNGIGMNPVDHFVYGCAYTGNTAQPTTMLNVNLYRISAGGTLTNLGKLPTTGLAANIPSPGGASIKAEVPNFSAGTVDANGTYYYSTIRIKTTGVNKILNYYAFGTPLALTASDLQLYFCWLSNVSTLTSGTMPTTPTGYYELDVTNTVINGSLVSFVNQFNALFPNNLNNIDGGIQDFAVNPLDFKVYGYVSYFSGANLVGQPVSFTAPVAPGGLAVVSSIGTTPNTTPGEDIAGVQFDEFGNFYGLFNNGSYGSINLTTGAITLSPTTLPTTGGVLRGDLASAATANFPLPITLVNFEGHAFAGYNELQWEISKDSKGTSFEMQRSLDSRSFTAIHTVAFVAGKTQYTVTDNQPGAVNYYRLKSTADDGRISYSKVVTLVNNGRNSDLLVYPTVISDNKVNITVNASAYNLSVYNLAGQEVFRKAIAQSGNNTAVALPALAAGQYLVKVQGTNDQNISGTKQIIIR